MFPWIVFGVCTTGLLLSRLDTAWSGFLGLILLLDCLRAWQAVRAHPGGRLDWQGDALCIDGRTTTGMVARFRGRWVALRWRDGRGRQATLCLWPGDLSERDWRELRDRLLAPVDAGHTHLLAT